MDSLLRSRARGAVVAGLLAGLLTAGVAATTKGPDAGAYTGTDATTFSFVDISGGSGGIAVLGGTDDGTVALALPFAFKFYGQTYPFVCVSANGALYFVTADSDCTGILDFANTDLGSVAPPGDRPAVLPLWSDLTFQVAGAGAVFYQTLGTGSSRRFVVQWNDAFPQGSADPVTFQVILGEAGNTVLFQYKTVNLGAGNAASNGAQASIGIRNAGALNTQQQIAWSFGAPGADRQHRPSCSRATPTPGDLTGDHQVNCDDANLIRAAFGKRRGQAGYNAAADTNNDGVVSVIDFAAAQQEPAPRHQVLVRRRRQPQAERGQGTSLARRALASRVSGSSAVVRTARYCLNDSAAGPDRPNPSWARPCQYGSGAR